MTVTLETQSFLPQIVEELSLVPLDVASETHTFSCGALNWTVLNTAVFTCWYLAMSSIQKCNVGELKNKKDSDKAVPSLWLEEDRRVA